METSSILRASITLWSRPSNRPQNTIRPEPDANALTRDWVRGLPRGVIYISGLSSDTLSIAFAATSGFNTMPGPPPDGGLSTLRCLLVEKSRMSTVSSCQMPLFSAPPMMDVPNTPGKASGKRVRAVARQGLRGEDIGACNRDGAGFHGFSAVSEPFKAQRAQAVLALWLTRSKRFCVKHDL